MIRFQWPLTVAAALTAAAVLASCSQTGNAVVAPTGQSATPSASTTAATSARTPPARPSPSTSVGQRIEIIVTGKQVKPRPATVNIAVGELLTIAVTSDHDDTLHAHAFDIEKAVKAGQRLEITVKGAEPGVYEVELHDPELRLLQVAVR